VVMITAWYGGPWTALLAAAIGGVGGTFLILDYPGAWERLTLFMLATLLIVVVQMKLKSARNRINHSFWVSRRALCESEAANRAKDEFITMISHELRPPLAVMGGWARMLTSHQDPAIVKAASAIDRGVRLQSKLLEDLLDLSRISRRALKLDVKVLDIVPL